MGGVLLLALTELLTGYSGGAAKESEDSSLRSE
jgi:hypothetical protein